MSEENEAIKNTSTESNNEKRLLFEANFTRFNIAKKKGFYLECMWILYAYLEDRTSAFLYYIGFTSQGDRQKVSGREFVKGDIRKVLGLINNNQIRYKFNTLSGKLQRINQIVNCNYDNLDEKDKYLTYLKEIVDNIKNKQGFLDALDYLQNHWREKRNELTHALFSKKHLEKYDELLPIIEAGYDNIRVFDNVVKFVKRKRIREKFKIK